MLEQTLTDLEELLFGVSHEYFDVGLRNISLHVGTGHFPSVACLVEGTCEVDTLNRTLEVGFLRNTRDTSVGLTSVRACVEELKLLCP